jgi:hypothetical protein
MATVCEEPMNTNQEEDHISSESDLDCSSSQSDDAFERSMHKFMLRQYRNERYDIRCDYHNICLAIVYCFFVLFVHNRNEDAIISILACTVWHLMIVLNHSVVTILDTFWIAYCLRALAFFCMFHTISMHLFGSILAVIVLEGSVLTTSI